MHVQSARSDNLSRKKGTSRFTVACAQIRTFSKVYRASAFKSFVHVLRVRAQLPVLHVSPLVSRTCKACAKRKDNLWFYSVCSHAYVIRICIQRLSLGEQMRSHHRSLCAYVQHVHNLRCCPRLRCRTCATREREATNPGGANVMHMPVRATPKVVRVSPLVSRTCKANKSFLFLFISSLFFVGHTLIADSQGRIGFILIGIFFFNCIFARLT